MNECPMVAVSRTEGQYPVEFPFGPSQQYPEYKGKDLSFTPNYVYEAVRGNFRLLGYDAEHFGQPEWNPLGHLIKPGDRVFIKPNLVTHEHRGERDSVYHLYSVITHPSVVRAVADYAAIALKGEGEIVIGDNPSIDADFEQICIITTLDMFEGLYRDNFGIKCRVMDLRPMRTDNLAYYGFKSKTRHQLGDPESSTVIDLGKHSYLNGLNPFLFRGVFTKRWETIKHHLFGKHEYCISNTILNSDVFISIPKLKAHHKVGATLNLKGLVGANANKNYLVHWRIGFPGTGGDEFPVAHRRRDYLFLAAGHTFLDLLPEKPYLWLRDRLKNTRLSTLFMVKHCHSYEKYRGAWDGNDTCWRMVADLYNTFVRDITGRRKRLGREMKFFSVVDGVLAGEENGPFNPVPKVARTIVSGDDLLLVDCAAVRLMDFNLNEIKYISHLIEDQKIDLGKVKVVSDSFDVADFFGMDGRYLQFTAPSGWKDLTIGETANEDHHSSRGQGREADASDEEYTEAAA